MSHIASRLYNYLTEDLNVANSGLKMVWERDLGNFFDEDEWDSLVKPMLKPMRDARSKLIQFKILNQLNWTPVKLHRAGISNSKACWRCKLNPGDMEHMFLTCPFLTTYWYKVMEKINKYLNLVLTPALCLLNSLDRDVTIEQKKALWLKAALTTSKRVILRHWRGKNNTTYTEWYAALSETALYERMIHKINGQLGMYEDIFDTD